jgi:hypothetical protein
MQVLDEVKKVTTELDGSQSTIEFLAENFPEVLAEGCYAAEKMAGMFNGQKVQRSYFLPCGVSDNDTNLLPLIIQVTEVKVTGVGIVTLYDTLGKMRVFPSLLFKFSFRPDGKAVLCSGPKFSVLFELLA